MSYVTCPGLFLNLNQNPPSQNVLFVVDVGWEPGGEALKLFQ
jgi:hypothetical protein